MSSRSIVIYGLPESGKTTFLAALWHLVTAREIETVLRFSSLKDGDHSHLNAIAARWRDAEPQKHTELSSTRLVTMNLLDGTGRPIRVSFPDLSGEAYLRMWEARDCDPDVAKILRSGAGVLLFVHSDRIKLPIWVVEEAEQMRELGLEGHLSGTEVPWKPEFAPTQVQLVELLQMLNALPLDIGPRRVAVILSAWDKIEPEQRTPNAFLRERLPLLEQYLQGGAGIVAWRVYGVSAQGGDLKTDADNLRAVDVPSKRIRVVLGTKVSHDLTEPLQWLMD